MAQFPQRLSLYLANAFTSDPEDSAHFFKSAAPIIYHPESQLEHPSLTFAKGFFNDFRHLLFAELSIALSASLYVYFKRG